MAIEEKDIMRPMMAIMMAVLMLGIVTSLIQASEPPAATFCCPLEVDVCFYTYEELYDHFTTAHPTEPIEIIWGD